MTRSARRHSAHGRTDDHADAPAAADADVRNLLVLLGLGGSDRSAVDLGIALCREHRAIMTVAHVVDMRLPWWGGAGAGAAYLACVEDAARAGRYDISRLCESLPSDLLVRTCVLHGTASVVSQVRQLVASSRLDLVVASSDLAGTLRGSHLARRLGAATIVAPADATGAGDRLSA